MKVLLLILFPFRILWWFVKLLIKIIGCLLGGWGAVGRDLKSIRLIRK